MILKALFPAKKTPAWFTRMFVILYGILWIYSAIKFIPEYKFFWVHARAYGFLYTTLAIYMVLMLFWLFRLDKKGWAMLMLNFCYNVISMLYMYFNQPKVSEILVYRRSPADLLLPLFICGTILYYFNRKDVLKTFQVTPGLQLLVIIVSAIVVITHIFLNRNGSPWNYYFG